MCMFDARLSAGPGPATPRLGASQNAGHLGRRDPGGRHSLTDSREEASSGCIGTGRPLGQGKALKDGHWRPRSPVCFTAAGKGYGRCGGLPSIGTTLALRLLPTQ